MHPGISVVEDSCLGKNWQKPRQRKHCCNWRQELFARQKEGSVTSSQNFQYSVQKPSYYFQFLVTTDSCLTNPCVCVSGLGAYLIFSLWRGYRGNIEYKHIHYYFYFFLQFLTQIFFYCVIHFRWFKNNNNIKRPGLWHFHAVNISEDHLTIAKWMRKQNKDLLSIPITGRCLPLLDNYIITPQEAPGQ